MSTLAEDLRLMAATPEGKHHGVTGLHTAMGTALLLELTLAGAVTAADGGKLVVAAGADPEPLLARARARLAADGPWEPVKTIMAVAMPPDEDAVRDRLVERGALGTEAAKRFGLLKTTRFPLRDAVGRDALTARVAPVLHGEEPIDERSRWLAMIITPYSDFVARGRRPQPCREGHRAGARVRGDPRRAGPAGLRHWADLRGAGPTCRRGRLAAHRRLTRAQTAGIQPRAAETRRYSPASPCQAP